MTVWFWDPSFHTEDNWGNHMQLLYKIKIKIKIKINFICHIHNYIESI